MSIRLHPLEVNMHYRVDDQTALGLFSPRGERLGAFGLRFLGRFFIILNGVLAQETWGVIAHGAAG